MLTSYGYGLVSQQCRRRRHPTGILGRPLALARVSFLATLSHDVAPQSSERKGRLSLTAGVSLEGDQNSAAS